MRIRIATIGIFVSDRETLYFWSNRVGGLGDNDLYVTTRIKERPQKVGR